MASALQGNTRSGSLTCWKGCTALKPIPERASVWRLSKRRWSGWAEQPAWTPPWDRAAVSGSNFPEVEPMLDDIILAAEDEPVDAMMIKRAFSKAGISHKLHLVEDGD